MSLLEVDNLRVQFPTLDGAVRAVDGLTFQVDKGEVVAIVGESGCGKSVTSMSVLRLLPTPPARISGTIRFDGRDLLQMQEGEMRQLRGKDIAMVFQEPMSSLNPVLTIGRQIEESLHVHESLGAAAARHRALSMLELVGLPDPSHHLVQYPHELSGGMRQRVMIAMALICSPRLLIADEPTTALDVTIQAQILDLLRDLNKRLGAAIMFITHDLGVVAEIADRVIVMYAGRKVEEGRVNDLFNNPLHPYTRGLLAAMPVLGASLQADDLERLAEIPGQVPTLRHAIPGCPFASRCQNATERCRTEAPELARWGDGQQVACHNHGMIAA